MMEVNMQRDAGPSGHFNGDISEKDRVEWRGRDEQMQQVQGTVKTHLND